MVGWPLPVLPPSPFKGDDGGSAAAEVLQVSNPTMREMAEEESGTGACKLLEKWPRDDIAAERSARSPAPAEAAKPARNGVEWSAGSALVSLWVLHSYVLGSALVS